MTALAALLLLSTVTNSLGQPRLLEPSWSVTLDDLTPIVPGAWSPTSTCVAVATDSAVHVVDAAGRLLWVWKFRERSGFTRPRSLAVSPACDAVVLGGDGIISTIERRDLMGRILWAIFSQGGSLRADRKWLLELAPIERPGDDPKVPKRMFQ